MLLDPISTRPDTGDFIDADLPVTPLPDPTRVLPDDLGSLVVRARRDRGSALALVHLLLERGWTAPEVSSALDGLVHLTRSQIEALASVRRPRTSASDVADRLVANRRPLTRVPHPRSG
ncbi:hypothetical protein [Actinomycetospora termitidis]|uniref:ANTAR domain-containing protein n=1 Tax=Actinomycetospora termitidis TaxID=3053470 RepID=A0ABT7MJB1_9PSEU|nr:hypothetical protein [Actinomycetospora sp. Odt1-22]MDL5160556.1 hypothetical protein [Actinomycetospora sp. Odt1-22]